MIDVYWNTRREEWSLRENGRVVGYEWLLCMHDVTLVVRQSAVARIRRTGVREVCAWARGTRQPFMPELFDVGKPLHFDPFRHDTFVTDEGVPILEFPALYFDGGGTVYRLERCR